MIGLKRARDALVVAFVVAKGAGVILRLLAERRRQKALSEAFEMMAGNDAE